MTIATLNKALLRDLPAVPAGRKKLRIVDAQLSGFHMELAATGSITYRLRYRNARGQVRDIRLGKHPELTPDEARKLALKYKGDVWRGGDPAAERDRLRAIPTFETFVREHILPHAKETLRSYVEVEGLMRLRVVPALGKLHLDEITPLHVARFRKGMIDEGLSASRVNAHLAALRRAFNLAIEWQFFQGRNPAASPGMLRTEGREMFLDAAQVKGLLLALAADPDQGAASAVALLALTGARKSEILLARWSCVDFDRRILWVPRSKSGRRRPIFLSDQAIAVLKLQPRQPGAEFVFPSPRRDEQALSELRGVWARVKLAADLPEDLRLHDLRHTFASLLANDGVPLYDIGKLLGHTQLATTSRYAHLQADRQLEAVNSVGRLAVPTENESVSKRSAHNDNDEQDAA
ncbi:site-specific integrase [Acidocella facilis]|uniref:site-specific integrase n=1 Tax=Acidocella facilis TaxID=525 RepID=UPI00047B6500|nr:site-specific integrase [Acidocella facilis]